MAIQADWNRSLWRKLDNLSLIDEKEVIQIFNDEIHKVQSVMDTETPVLYGGLKASSYAIVERTPSGISGKVGYVNRQHISLNPSDPHYDNITNPDLMEHLARTKKSSSNILAIEDAMTDFRNNCEDRLKDYWKNKWR